ncbi:MAG: TlyA family RNA methyltransferase [Ktedonobacteraceae bacterium]
MVANKERLDAALVRRGLAPSRERARALIMAGQVYVGDRLVDKPGTLVSLDADCRLAQTPEELKYVSRGGLKLEKALATFQLSPEGLVALDVGASTGGFTHCLLEHGARRVYAVDVGHGQLAWTLRHDPRVVVMEHTNIRHLTSLPEPIHCAVIDVSFISLRLVLPAIVPLLADPRPSETPPQAWSEAPPTTPWAHELLIPRETPPQAWSEATPVVGTRFIASHGRGGGAPDTNETQSPIPWIIALVKPQFEAGKAEADKGSGVISDPAVHTRVLDELQEWIQQHTPFKIKGLTDSPILGRDGNREFLLYLGL